MSHNAPYRSYVQRAVAPALLPPQLQLKGFGWPAGCHFLLSESTQVPIPEVLGFLRDHYLSRALVGLKRSPRSLEAGTYDLKDYYDFLDAYELKALEVGLSQIEDYVNSMHLNDSPVTGKPFARATIKRRASTICSFYRWASENGLTKRRIDSRALSGLPKEEIRYETQSDRLQTPRAQRRDTKVRFIPNEKLRKILDGAGALRVDVKNDEESPSDRLRLMLECALQAGLRRAEVSALETEEVLKGARLAQERLLDEKCAINVIRKGGRRIFVMLPVWLIQNLEHYIKNERKQAIDARLQSDAEFSDHGFLFVKDIEKGRRAGDALSPEYLSGPMRRIQLELGICVGQSSTEDSRGKLYGVHALRHTYALLEYFSRKSAGDNEPWLYVQAQLGHSSLSTTTDIYLAAAAEYEYEFGALLKEGIEQVKARG